MWMQPPPPVDNRWVLHISASPHQVDEILTDLCIHHRARAFIDPQLPAYLAGACSPDEPPAWMDLARDELERRGYRTRWCSATCEAHPGPPPTAPAAEPHHDRTAGRTAPRRRAPLHRLISGTPHHRFWTPAQRIA